MSHSASLQISPGNARATLTPAQKRFNTLLRQIEQARATLSAWNENVAQYRRLHAQVLEPLQAELRVALRQWVFALDALLDQRKWSGTERGTIAELVCEGAADLLAGGEDAELKALFDKHAEVDFETSQREATLAMKDLAEEITGLDLGDDHGITSEEELMARMRSVFEEQAAAHEARQAQREARSARRPKSAAQQRREAEEQQATQSVREIYRKLASSLHPDRETDEGQRVAKTALMQRVNQAYATGDLLALLELQLQIEQIDATHVAQASEARLKHYNKVLAEQLAELKAEIQAVEMAWRMEFGLDPDPFSLTDPRKLDRELDATRSLWRGDLARMQRELRMFAEVPATKRWLKRQRDRLQHDDFELPF